MYTQADFWNDHQSGGFRDAVTNALMSLLPEENQTSPVPTPDPVPYPDPPIVEEPTSGNSGQAHTDHKPPKTR
jgi:hypothetical protein